VVNVADDDDVHLFLLAGLPVSRFARNNGLNGLTG
jgi:hypothetical protein